MNERNIWAFAVLMAKRYGADASAPTAQRADQLMAEGAMEGCATRKRIMAAIDKLQAEKPVDGEAVQ